VSRRLVITAKRMCLIFIAAEYRPFPDCNKARRTPGFAQSARLKTEYGRLPRFPLW
jgi:hypothetical protein